MKLFNHSFTMKRPHVLSTCSGPKILFFISLTLVFFLNASRAEAWECDSRISLEPSECLALKQIYDSQGGPNWKDRTTGEPIWPDGPFCWATGVITGLDCIRDEHNISHVTGLDLYQVGMTGGELPDVFLALPYLESLNVGRNSLTGLIPGSILDLQNLRVLNLGENNFTGAIPVGLADLENLRVIDLGGNDLTGRIPEELLGHNAENTSGRRQSINLSGNDLSGELPTDWGNANIYSLNVTDNPKLEGRIPDEYIQLDTLDRLFLRDTGICVPQYKEMQDWLKGIWLYSSSGIPCDDLKPGTLTASDGTSTNHVTVGWGTSVDAGFYILERAKGEKGPFTWNQLAKSSTNHHLDSSAEPGIPYNYRVKGCSADNTCSSFTNSDLGYRALQSPTLNKEAVFPEWNSVKGDIQGIIFYEVFGAKDTRYYSRFEGSEGNFKLLEKITDINLPVFTIIPPMVNTEFVAVAIRRCTFFTCSIAAMWNDGSPPIGPAVNLLLNDNELE